MRFPIHCFRLVIVCGSLFACADVQGNSTSGVRTTGQAAPVSFVCPADGTRTQTMTGSTRTTTTWGGADPTDPQICLTKRGQVVANRYLFEQDNVSIINDMPAAKLVMAAAFSGATTPSCYKITSTTTGAGITGDHIFERCFKQIGPAITVVNGVNTPTIAFWGSERGLADNGYSGEWVYYFDPQLNLFVKGDPTTIRGNPAVGFVRSVLSGSR